MQKRTKINHAISSCSTWDGMSLIDDSICEVLVFTGLFQKYGPNSGGVTEKVAANEHALSLALLKRCFASEHF